LPRWCNRQDVPLYYNNGSLAALTPKSWAGKLQCLRDAFNIENDTMMEEKNNNRTKCVHVRLTPNEYEATEKKWKSTDCPKLSDYIRHCLFGKPIVTTFRNQSTDELMEQLAHLYRELNAIGNNFNQSVKRLHTLRSLPEFKSWIIAYDLEKTIISNKIEEVKKIIANSSKNWLL
jgi:hypothetical protein